MTLICLCLSALVTQKLLFILVNFHILFIHVHIPKKVRNTWFVSKKARNTWFEDLKSQKSMVRRPQKPEIHGSV